ncbi:zf-HC2 domain-containing protein [Sinosporangium siamense]|uniref:Putative zinc-finger domain-containing protein n=1 Tax=Sinosporangium siamense TaxID=1367973 RepID=A0A919V9Q1_9ACTN|nr:zf-HC2 domain-containing protein [Sinosporangium siamense]GII94562.1 hypothetical protein Ssi02_47930 [Sinosporangium siamense]
MKTGWHLANQQIAAYVGGSLAPSDVMSVEAHLERCGECRTRLPADEQWLATSWTGIADVVMRPRRGVPERIVERMGVPGHLARLLVATPALSRAWLSAVVVVLVFAVGATRMPMLDAYSAVPMTLVAPVLPLAGIALAYGRRVDPAHELVVATPYAGARLLLVRAIAVLVTAVALAACTMPFVAGPPLPAWLLPALALTSACLALSTRVSVLRSAVSLAAAWTALVAGAALVHWQDLIAAHPLAQAFYGSATFALALVTYLRRHRLDTGES